MDGRGTLAAQFERRAIDYAEDVELVRSLLRHGDAAAGMVTEGSLRSSLLHEEQR
jgi:hypothetical protein